MRNQIQILLTVLITILFVGVDFASAQPAKRRMIFLSISADVKAMVGTQQEWIEMLQDVGADRVSSKTARGGSPAVEETETSTSTVINVTGFVVGNKLKLPGGTFSIRDKAKIRALLQELRDDGAKVALAEKKAFGLTSEQLVEVHQKFARTVDFETKGQNAGDVVNKLATNTGFRFALDDSARAALGGNETVVEELSGMSTGMAMATIVRPLGLVIEPKRDQGQPLEVQILDSRSSKENWPIGWPIEEPPVIAEPKLFIEIPTVEIRNFPANAVLNQLQKKADVPFFYDWNSMAREGIDLAEVKVTVVRKKPSVLSSVSSVLKQTKPKMFYEIRLDENGKPFLWLSVR